MSPPHRYHLMSFTSSWLSSIRKCLSIETLITKMLSSTSESIVFSTLVPQATKIKSTQYYLDFIALKLVVLVSFPMTIVKSGIIVAGSWCWKTDMISVKRSDAKRWFLSPDFDKRCERRWLGLPVDQSSSTRIVLNAVRLSKRQDLNKTYLIRDKNG